MERILARIALRSARPRDLTRLRQALGQLPQIIQLLQQHNQHQQFDMLLSKLQDFSELFALLTRAIIETPPLLIRDGGVIAPGYHQELMNGVSWRPVQRNIWKI